MLRRLKGVRGLALAAAIGLMSQGAFGETPPAREQAAVVKASALSMEQIEADARAYIEALHRRHAEELAEILKAAAAARLELASAELAAQG